MLAPIGLSIAEAAARLDADGANETARARPGWLRDTLAVVREPMTLLLLACGAIYLALGDRGESLMLLGFVAFIMAITLYQERRTGRALEALRDLSSPRALVIRDGVERRIPGREVVRGDLVVLAEGDRVPADAAIVSGAHLTVDESLLTGESAPVRKSVWDRASPPARPGGDDLPFVYAGTLVVAGQAIVEVLATGARAELGRIGESLGQTAEKPTPLQRETRRLVIQLALAGGALSLIATCAYAVMRDDWLGGLLAGLTLAMAILPNELPVVVTIFLALGARRLARRRVLTRRVPAVETLGAATVLCVDKTGTLTENRMTVRRLVENGDIYDVRSLDEGPLPEAFHEVVEYSILASRRDPFDPMERAFKQLGESRLAGTEHLRTDWTLEREWPLSRRLLAVAQAWRAPDRVGRVVAAKGAPEAIAELCHLDAAARALMFERASAMARDGLRVLAVARGELSAAPLPDDARALALELVGLVGLADPVRPTVAPAIAECRAAGVRVVMITGDYPATASAVARQIGLEHADQVVTGAELERLPTAEVRERVRTTNVFARVLPEQKLRLVEALAASGEIVAMTGDGVNDAPALKAAHIGIAMGGRGTDVAREAAQLVLLDDDFASLVTAVRVGRRIVDNLRKALAFVLAVHIPIVGLTLVPIFLRWPLVLMPVHIAFLHLLIDPACSVAFEAEPEEDDVMRRPPRDAREPLFGRPVLGPALMLGAAALATVLAVFGVALRRGAPVGDARALAFATLVLVDVALIFTNRSWSRSAATRLRAPNAALWWVVGGTIALLAGVLFTPGLRALFGFGVLHVGDLLLCGAAGALSLAGFEVIKLLRRRTPCSSVT